MTESTFYARIKELRIGANLTQAEFGAKIGITKAAVSDIENNRDAKQTTVPRLIIIADSFNVSTDWLLGRTDNAQSHHAPIPPDDNTSEI